MLKAIIDIGTNTFHLLIAEVKGDAVNVIYKTNVPVRLGEGTINEGHINPAAFGRGIDTLKAFRATIDEYKAERVKATATAAVRSAQNGEEFIREALVTSGIGITLISGNEEAEYIFEGVRASGAISDRSLIMDIGGGSTEFILCTESRILWKQSFDIGAARLMQAFFNSDPLNKTDLSRIKGHMTLLLKPLIEVCAKYLPQTLIGSAGAFETFAGMLNSDFEVDTVKTREIDIKDYRSLSRKLLMSTHAERSAMKGLIPLRVDMIVMAVLLVDYVIKETSVEKMRLSTYDLKMGVLQSLIKE